jgi:P-type Ca2+ transporter type 2C
MQSDELNNQWHLKNVTATLKQLDSHLSGLTEDEAAKRLQQFGRNQLEEKKKSSGWKLFLSQFKDVMILILLAAALVSGIAGDLKDTIVIALIVTINAVIGFIQEYRAEKAMDALKKMTNAIATVKRSNQTRQISSHLLVPGDVVLLQAGDLIPADMRLLETHAFQIEESSLTGESYAVEKTHKKLNGESIAIADRNNMAYKGTVATYGRAVGIVVATGMQTEIGSIAKLLQEKEVLTPLQKRLSYFGKKLSHITLAICLVLFITGLIRGEEPVQMLLVAISVAVAAIPEALPAVITIALAIGAKKLVRINALIRRLPAVETLGSVTVICTDKTGTLTQNKMTVKKALASSSAKDLLPTLQPFELLLLCMSCNQDTTSFDVNSITGDPTEVALFKFATNHKQFDQAWLNSFKRVYELPFDSDRKMMTTVHEYRNKYLVITKGALESVLSKCVVAGDKDLTDSATAMAEEGMRVIAYGCKLMEASPLSFTQQEVENNLRLVGVAGMIDPPRDEAKQAVTDCVTAGIVPVMITGDHPITARAIAKEIGILRSDADKVISGIELVKLSEKDLEKQIGEIKVYARVIPQQKLQIVKALQKQGHIVSMTGDGVNDAPALKQADIGVAMGITGTDVSKEAAHMILLDDNFATIVKAVKEGRRIFDNIRKFIRYMMSGNSSEIWTIFLAPLIGLPLPLLPIHILWINLVTDGLPALALANEPAEQNIIQRPPRKPDESLFANGLGVHILWVGLLIGALCLAVQAWAFDHDSPKSQTLVFTILCFSQMGHVLAIRSESTSLFRQGLFSNPLLISSVILTVLMQLALLYIPVLNVMFSTQPLTVKELLLCVFVAAITFHAVEFEKFIRAKPKGQR